MRFIKVIVYFIVILFAVVTLYMGYRNFKGDQLLSVQTGSMVPVFYPGDAVATRKVTLEELLVGDIVAYRSRDNPKVLVSHRLVSINHVTGKLITHGDALELQDVPFPASQVVGTVYKVVPNAGMVLDWLHKPVGLIIAVYIPAAFILGGEAKRLAKQYNKPYYQLYSYGLKRQG